MTENRKQPKWLHDPDYLKLILSVLGEKDVNAKNMSRQDVTGPLLLTWGNLLLALTLGRHNIFGYEMGPRELHSGTLSNDHPYYPGRKWTSFSGFSVWEVKVTS